MRKISSSAKTSCKVRESAVELARSRPKGFSTTMRAHPSPPRSSLRPIERTMGTYAAGGVAR